jgi:hypothetical protein
MANHSQTTCIHGPSRGRPFSIRDLFVRLMHFILKHTDPKNAPTIMQSVQVIQQLYDGDITATPEVTKAHCQVVLSCLENVPQINARIDRRTRFMIAGASEFALSMLTQVSGSDHRTAICEITRAIYQKESRKI